MELTKWDLESRTIENRKAVAMERIATALENLAVDEGCHLDLLVAAIAEVAVSITTSGRGV